MHWMTMRALALSGTVALGACAGARTPTWRPAPTQASPTQSAPTQAAMPVAARMPLADFALLAWLEGTWRGEGVDQPAFYERYGFVDDSTMRVESFPDSTLAAEPERGEVRWRDGLVTTGSGGALWIVTEYDDAMIRFESVAGARNSFVWRRDSDDAWTAVLSWPAAGQLPARERVYHLRCMP